MPGMRLRTAASGHDSSPTQDNINVARPGQPSSDEPQRKRIKLKFTKPAIADKEPPPVNTRPKRLSAARVSYLDDVVHQSPQPLKKTNRSAVSSSMSLISSPLASSKVLNGSEVAKEQDTGYSADFLAMFVEDPEPTTSSVLGSASTGKSKSKSKRKRTSTDVVIEQPSTVSSSKRAIPISSDEVVMVGADADTVEPRMPTKPRVIDTPETAIKKLRVACHALESLNISAGPVSRNLPTMKQGE